MHTHLLAPLQHEVSPCCVKRLAEVNEHSIQPLLHVACLAYQMLEREQRILCAMPPAKAALGDGSQVV
jgi:hypothetical protein